MIKTSKEKTQSKKVKEAKVKKPVVKSANPKAPLKTKKTAVARPKKITAQTKRKPVVKKEKPLITSVTPQKPPEAVRIKEAEVILPKRQEKQIQKPLIQEAVKEAKKEALEPKKAVLEPKAQIAPAPARIEPVVLPKAEVKIVEPAIVLKELELALPITVKDLSIRLQEKPSAVIKTLMGMGIMVGINHSLDETVLTKLCAKYNYKIKKALGAEEITLSVHNEVDKLQDLHFRSPIVTLMGHVDHGKTSLLDAIRQTNVAESEHGGITQHIGAYRVSLKHGEITFLDTPGHEAFTAMRARGASITDIVILVVAADDGIMPQTQEAIDHARAAGVPIIVAVNKMDKPAANIDKVKKQLAELDLRAEDWGGKTITVPVSAKNRTGIDDLLEMVLLEAQMLELKCNPSRLARGVVIEAKMAKGRGPVATLLVQNGTLHLNENIIVGTYFGKIRAMFNDKGASVVSASPGVPVEVLGISGIPQAGEQFFVIEDEKTARNLAQMRLEKEKQEQIKIVKRISLEDLHAEIEAGKIKELKIIIKADVQGSLEAIKDTLSKLNVSEIKLDFIHTGIGNINTSDVILAVASNALILGFNVAADELAKDLVAKEGVDVKTYNIIYELANDIKAAVEGMLEPKIKKTFAGRAEVRKVFRLSRSGIIAGCFVTKGKFNRNSQVSLVRNGQPIFEGKLSSLKRFKDDVKEVQEGFECGMALAGFDALAEGDIIEAYEIEKIARRL